jgi:solute carrier family 25 S-adenosylmethionine transporter 26
MHKSSVPRTAPTRPRHPTHKPLTRNLPDTRRLVVKTKWASANVGAIPTGGLQRALSPPSHGRRLPPTTGAKTLSELGVRVLFSGCATTSAFALAVGALQFAIFGALQPRVGVLGASVAGALGSCIASVPQEVIKQRLVTGAPKASSLNPI